MEFEFLQRKISIRWSHILLYLVVLLGLILVVSIPGFVYFGFIEYTPDGYAGYVLSIGYLLAAIMEPIMAFIFLRFSGIFKLERNVDFCRSMSGADFLVMATISIIAFVARISFGYIQGIGLGDFIWLVGTFASLAASAIIMYLWMLLLLKPDMKRLMKILQNAASVVIAFLLLEYGAVFLHSTHILEMAYTPDIFGSESISFAVGLFLFAFILLYHTPKRLGREAYLFASLYLGSGLLFILGASINLAMGGVSTGFEEHVLGFIEAVISLALIFALSRHAGQANL